MFHARRLSLAIVAIAAAGAAVATVEWREVHGASNSAADNRAPAPERPQPPPELHFATQVQRGEHVFRTMGCPACHGEAGRGGVSNPNYARGTVPALDVLDDQFGLETADQAHAVVAMIEQGGDPAQYHGVPPFEGWDRFVARYRDVVALIENGSIPAKKDPNGPVPPLQMVAWRDRLPPDVIRAVIAYLMTLYDWNA